MSFSAKSIEEMPYLRSYNEAHAYYTATAAPKPTKTTPWQANERPLVDENKYHYRIVAGADPDDADNADNASYFDLVLYETALIRYMRPTAAHATPAAHEYSNATFETVYLDSIHAKTTTMFLRRHGWDNLNKLWTTEGHTVAVPLNYNTPNKDRVEGQWLARLNFVVSGQGSTQIRSLALEGSEHCTVYRRKASNAQTAARAALRAKIEAVHDVLWLGSQDKRQEADEFIDAVFNEQNKQSPVRQAALFGPGRGIYTLMDSSTHRRHNALLEEGIRVFDSLSEPVRYPFRESLLDPDQALTADSIAMLLDLYGAAYHSGAGKAEYKQRIVRRTTKPSATSTRRTTTTTTTDTSVRRAVTNYLFRRLGLDTKAQAQPLSHFMSYDKFPRTAYAHK